VILSIVDIFTSSPAKKRVMVLFPRFDNLAILSMVKPLIERIEAYRRQYGV
jgi:hypothetical protein